MYYNWILRKPVLFIFITLICITVIGMGVKGLSISNDYENYFSKSDMRYQEYKKMGQHFTDEHVVIIALESDRKDVFHSDILELIDLISDEALDLTHAIRVNSLTNANYIQADNDTILTEALFSDPGYYKGHQLAQRKAEALSDKTLLNSIISPGGDATGIFISFIYPDGERSSSEISQLVSTEVLNWIATIEKRWLAKQTGIDIKFRISGDIFLERAFVETAHHDSVVLFPAIVLVNILCMMLLIRNLLAPLVSMVVVALSVVVAVGVLGWAGVTFAPDNVAATVMIVPIAIADAIHIVVLYLQGLNRGYDRRTAIYASVQANLKPVILTSLTTCIGFLTLNFSQVPIIQLMGNTVAIGVFVACVLSLTLLPALLIILPVEKLSPGSLNNYGKRSSRIFSVHGKQVITQQRTILVGFCVISIAALFASIELNELEESMYESFTDEMRFKQDSDWIQENLVGLRSIELMLPANQENGVTTTQYLNTLSALTAWLRERPEVINVSSFSDVIARINKVMHNNDPEMEKVPESESLASQYLLLYEMSLPSGNDLTSLVNINKSATRVALSLKSITSAELLALDNEIQGWLSKNAPSYMRTINTGTDLMFSSANLDNMRELLMGLISAVLLIFFCMIYALKSLRLSLISLVPNLIPAILAFGLWGLINGEVGVSTVIVLGMTIGIVVDDTVHFLVKYQFAKNQLGYSKQDSIIFAFENVGRAIVTTTVMLVLGNLMFLFSDFIPNIEMGVMSALIISAALVADFYLLPVLLLLFDNESSSVGGSKIPVASTASSAAIT